MFSTKHSVCITQVPRRSPPFNSLIRGQFFVFLPPHTSCNRHHTKVPLYSKISHMRTEIILSQSGSIKMPPPAKLDKLVLDTVKLIPSCTDSVSTIAAGASAARRAASSAKTFYDSGDRDLAAARMRRCEKLLSAVRDTHAEFDRRVNRLTQEVTFAGSQPAKHPGSWNQLSDQWWLEKANRLQELLSEVLKKQDELQKSWTLDDSSVHLSESYSEIVLSVSAAANDLMRSWKSLVEYVEEWEETARIIQAGIGESGSLIPS